MQMEAQSSSVRLLQFVACLLFLSTVVQGTAPSEAWFVGCFPDTGLLKNFQTVSVPGDTIGSGTNFTKQNAVKCAVKCSVANANHKYAVFSQTGICLCSNSVYNISGSVSSALCTQKTCQLLADESSCDGRTYHWLVNASKMITAVKIVSTNILQGSVPQKITVTTVPADMNATFHYTFGDGGSVKHVSSKVFSYIYSQAGFYKLTVDAMSDFPDSARVSDSKIVRIETKPYGTNVDIPAVLETEVTYNLTASLVEGNNMTVSGSTSIGATNIAGSGFDAFFVEDASIVAVGASIDELLRASNVFSNPNTGIYIMPNYKFPAKGIVAGFEMFVTKVGFLRLQAYRPVCSSGIYCYDSNSCSSSCPSSIDMMSNTTNTMIGKSPPLTIPKYKLVTEISLNANSTGLKYLKARSASFEVERGDVLAFILLSGEGDIGHATEVTNWEYHATVAGEVFPGTQITVSQTKLSLKHNIRAHLSTTSKVRISHKFTEPGFASLKIKATNPRYSEYQSEKYFHVQERISGFKLEIPKPHDEQAYEVQKQFTLTSSIDKGSNATFNWQLQLDTLNLSYNSTSKTHAFIPPSVGIYTLFANAKNLLGNENTTTLLRVQEKAAELKIGRLVNGMLISAASLLLQIDVTVVNGTNITLKATYEKTSENATISTISGETRHHQFTFASPAGCKVSEATVTAQNMIPGAVLTKTFQVGIICPILDLKVTVLPSLVKTGSTPKTITGRNQPVQVNVKIRQGSMVVYRIDKGDGTSDMRNHSDKLQPEEVSFMLVYTSGKVYSINVTVENPLSSEHFVFDIEVTDCPPELLEITGSPERNNPATVTRGTDYKVVGTITPAGNCSASKPEISYSIQFYSLDTNSLLTNTSAKIDALYFTIPKLSRPAGKYKITFTQVAYSSEGPKISIKTAYLTIKQTPLLASVASGSTRQIPLKKQLRAEDNTTSYYTFTLDGSPSYDPDNKSNPLTYEWHCMSKGFKPDGDRKYVCNHTDLRRYRPDSWGPRITVDTSQFTLNTTYTFVLKVAYETRQSNYSQQISFLSGSPPAVEFECITNCDEKWNVQEKLILRGRCPGCIDQQNIEHLWSITYSDGKEAFTAAQKLDKETTSTGFMKQNLVINAGKLIDNKGYKVILKAWYNPDRNKATTIELTRQTAVLPHSGTCTMFPSEGTVAETKFQIQCEKWQCPDIPMKYQFMTKTSGAKSGGVSVSSLSRVDYPIWYTGSEPRNPKNILPLGNPDKDYNLTIIVRIFNAFGSFKELEPIIVKVKNIISQPGKNASSVIEGSKPNTDDPSSLSQWATSAASILNEEKKPDTSATTAPTTEEETKSMAETRTKIIKSLAEADIKDISIANLKQLGEALGSVISKKDEVNEDGQDASTNLLSKMAESFLTNDQNNAGAETFEQASVALMGPLSDLMAITTSKTDGLIETAKGIQDEVTSRDGAPTQASPTGKVTQRPTKKQLVNEVDKTKGTSLKYIGIMDKLSEKLLKTKVAGENAMVAKTASFSLALEKRDLRSLANAPITTGGQDSGFQLPLDIFSQISLNGSVVSNNETEISCQGTSMKKILHTWDLDNAQNSASEIESLKLLSRDYRGMNVSNLTSDIVIKIKNRPEKLNMSRIKLNFPQEMSIRKERIKSYDSPLLVEFSSPDNSSSNFTVLIQFGYPPTKENYDAKLVITPAGIQVSKSAANISANVSLSSNNTRGNSSEGDRPLVRNSHIRVIDSKTIILWDFQNFTYAYLGNKDMFFNFFYTGDMPAPVLIPNEYTFDILEIRRSRNYTMRTFSCSCLYWSTEMDKWTDDGCKVDPYKTTFNETVCKCNHLTSFGGFYVKPTPIPALSADMFLKGYVLFVAVTITLALFVIGLVFARRVDKKDVLKVGVCPLQDNVPGNNYLYQITVWTGLRRGGGTKSNVYFILSGDNGDTAIRHLKDPDRTTFQQNSSDLFIFSTESSLGDLSHMRIWHDNSGGGWYLRKVVVTDLQTDKTFQFLCNRWLAVDKEDGQIEMVAPVSGKDDLKDFNYVFVTKTRTDLCDAHLWFSVYARPPRSPFTRCQRLACCVSLLMTSMMANAMFYNTFPKPTPETANYAAGLTFTWKQVYVAVISALITVPINVIIVTLFRLSKPIEIIEVKKKGSSTVGSKASLADNASVKSSESSATLTTPESPMFNKTGQEPLLVDKKKYEDKSGNEGPKEEKKKDPYLFPHWCIYVGWFLVFVSIVSSSVVVIIYGMVFGNSTSLEWLSSVILGFLQDIIVIQPVKIFAIAIIFAAIIKNIQDERPAIEEQGKKLAEDEEWLHAHADTSIGTAVDTTTLRPPDGVKLDAMRELRFKERKMYAIVREILMYSLFVMVTFSISYSLREETGFWQTNGLEKLFKLTLDKENHFKKEQFHGVVSYNDFWYWSEKTLISNLFPDTWYKTPGYPKKTAEFPGKLYINDLNHKIVNGVRLRQVRIKPASCTKNKDVKGIFKIDCAAPYGIAEEDKSNFVSNWTNQVRKRPTITRSNQPWLYQKWNELDGYPFMAELTTYFGGGYTQELFPRWPNRVNLDKLMKARWIDRHTRAVIIEFALFNPSTNHFSMVTVTFEFAATGGCIHYYSIYTFKLYRYTTGFAFFTIVCEVLFLLLLLLYMYRECKELYQLRWKYFTQFWNLVEVTINILSFVAIGFYVYRQKLATDLLQRLPAKKPQTFINFQFAAYIDQIFIYVVALIVFFVSIKFIKLLRFNRRMSILADTLKHAWKPLGMFSIVMGIVLISTFAFATIVFGRQMYGYRNMLVTAATQISLLLGKFDFFEYQNTNRVIGPIFFFLYIIMVNWILLNMFLSIINDSFEVVSDGLQEQSNDYEIVDFIMDQFKTWIGVGKTRKDEIRENIRWQSAKSKVNALRAFSANSKASKKAVRWCDDDVLSGLTRSSYWHDNPVISDSIDLDADDVNKTVDRFIECINLLYFDDSEIAEKMTKRVKQEISDFDFLQQEKARKT